MDIMEPHKQESCINISIMIDFFCGLREVQEIVRCRYFLDTV